MSPTFFCREGFYCLLSQGRTIEMPCSRLPTQFCPENSSHPIETGEGYYAINSHILEGGGYGDQRMCSPGSFCSAGLKSPCPPGRLGLIDRETRPLCAGPCPAGSHCPAGCRSPLPCASPTHFCPPGAGAPLTVPTGHYALSLGHYSLYLETPLYSQNNQNYQNYENHQNYHPFDIYKYSLNKFSLFASASLCPPGHFCIDGIASQCAPGLYGALPGLSTALCSGLCPPGHHCPAACQFPIPCQDPAFFCPPGSSRPTPASAGYYTHSLEHPLGAPLYHAQSKCPPGHHCQAGLKYACAPGLYGADPGLATALCSGQCPAGHFCPAACQFPIPCKDPAFFCPPGSPAPLLAGPGMVTGLGIDNSTRSFAYPAPAGSWAQGGLQFVCPGGRFGGTPGLATALCSGQCAPGYFCPAGATSNSFFPCGSDAVFCAEGAVEPRAVKTGFYTASYDYQPCPPGKFRNSTGTKDKSVSFNEATETRDEIATCDLCPWGTFKSEVGNSFDLCLSCNGKDSRSSDDRRTCLCTEIIPTGTSLYFNETSRTCQWLNATVLNEYLSSIAHQPVRDSLKDSLYVRSKEFICEPGYFCENGTRWPCASGLYGSEFGLSTSFCSGLCSPGHFCPLASVESTARKCGGNHLFCPLGSSRPTFVLPGYYTVVEGEENSKNNLTHSFQTPCEPGHFCPLGGVRFICKPGTYSSNFLGTNPDCEGLCEAGYFCLAGSTTNRQHVCGGSNYYCPKGSSHPFKVHEGFYGIHTGTNAGALRLSDSQNKSFGVEVPCEPGYFCSGGIKQPCGPGFYGGRVGLTNSNCSGLCARGHYCPSYLVKSHFPHTLPWTIWPGKPQTRANDFECGDVTVYCPPGSWFPIQVKAGHFTYGGGRNNRTRYGESPCPLGSYCLKGISILCPRGRYGNQTGLSLSVCSGRCPPGFYCPPGTAEPYKCPPGTYSTGDAHSCTPCTASEAASMSLEISGMRLTLTEAAMENPTWSNTAIAGVPVKVNSEETANTCTDSKLCCFR